jgi:transposase InsO family protein
MLTNTNSTAVEDIDHTRTKPKSPQTNGICERFHNTVLNEFYRTTFLKKLYHTLDELPVGFGPVAEAIQ